MFTHNTDAVERRILILLACFVLVLVRHRSSTDILSLESECSQKRAWKFELASDPRDS